MPVGYCFAFDLGTFAKSIFSCVVDLGGVLIVEGGECKGVRHY